MTEGNPKDRFKAFSEAFGKMVNYIGNINYGDYDVIVVGSGLTGSIIARELSNARRILIVERRSHIGGNVFDFKNEKGILVQKYGPHALHTNKKEIFDYVSKYAETFNYITRLNVFMKGQFTPSPFNFKTIDQYFPDEAKTIKETLLKEYPGRKSVTIVELLENRNPIIRKYADFLYESDYSLYTAKQWGIKPSEVDPSVLKRVPVLLNYDEQYFYDEYQFMPKGGFTSLMESILNHPNIKVILNKDFLDDFKLNPETEKFDGISDINSKLVIYTGPINELFGNRYGNLPYRSLRFDFKTLHMKSFQDAPTVAYPEAPDYTRITELTKMPYQDSEYTTIAYEYPLPMSKENEPYYPILTKESKETYAKYREAANKLENVVVCGRLGDFSYYNMDQAIEKALEIAKNLNE